MVNQQTLQGNWNEWKGKLRQKWGQLTNDDLQSFSGSVDQLIGLIQRKTGEARHSIEQYLEELSSNSASSFSQTAETVRGYANQAAESMQDSGRRAAEMARRGADEAQEMIRQRPGESAAVCFGAGIVFGVVLGLLMRSR
jgi:uncharacterized protein YjbJ (UPF0337 family)